MKRTDFHYDLPAELIAQQPLADRSASRLLCLERGPGSIEDRMFSELPDLLEAGDLLIFNDTRVIPARIFGKKDTGGQVEVLVERVLGTNGCLAQVRASKSPRPGTGLVVEGGYRLRVSGRRESFYELVLEAGPDPMTLEGLLAEHGHMPLPPYIQRADTEADRERYQTVYASRPGAVAAPTAGLHFDQELLAALDRRGVERARVTLHVGAGTFQPVRVEEIEQHRMHAEYLEVGEPACAAVAAARQRGGRVIAVGTTSVRCLETAAAGGALEPFAGDSRLFIYPGYRFRVVDGMITNFHLPESTLLMLVSAFAGRAAVLGAYRHAVREAYRFFSYGDAMLLT
jgi:S-adenosylmethionine:tRNA ribosyltransferase-isomerase